MDCVFGVVSKEASPYPRSSRSSPMLSSGSLIMLCFVNHFLKTNSSYVVSLIQLPRTFFLLHTLIFPQVFQPILLSREMEKSSITLLRFLPCPLIGPASALTLPASQAPRMRQPRSCSGSLFPTLVISPTLVFYVLVSFFIYHQTITLDYYFSSSNKYAQFFPIPPPHQSPNQRNSSSNRNNTTKHLL